MKSTPEERRAEGSKRYGTLSNSIDVKVTFDDGNTLVTKINTDLEGAKKYYIGKDFNLGQGDQDKMAKAIKVEQV